jgi:hypothetical protein
VGGTQGAPELVALVFRQASEKIIDLIRSLDGTGAKEAAAMVFTGLDPVIKALETVCPTAVTDLVRLRGFITLQAQWSATDTASVATLIEQLWSTVGALSGDRNVYADLAKDAAKKRAKAKDKTPVVGQHHKGGGGGGGSGGGGGRQHAASDTESLAHAALAAKVHAKLSQKYTPGKDDGCWACKELGFGVKQHRLRDCRNLGKITL